MHRNLYTILWLALFSIFMREMRAQSGFSVPDTIAYLSKTTDHSTIHWYLEIHNQRDTTLPMRWLYQPLVLPAAWQLSLQDPSTHHHPLQTDSADFTLQDSANEAANKLIIGIDHQGQTGYALLRFTIFEPGKRNDSVNLYFDVSVSAGMSQEEFISPLNIFPNPAREFLEIQGYSGPYTIRNTRGEIVCEGWLMGDQRLELNMPPGLYILHIEGDSAAIIKKISIE